MKWLLVSLCWAATLQAAPTVVPLRSGDDTIRAVVCLGADKAAGTITIGLADNSKQTIRVTIEPQRLQRRIKNAEGKPTVTDLVQPDAVIHFVGLAPLYSRPRLQRYTNEQQEDLIKRWDSFPAASKRLVTFEVRQQASGLAFYLDGNYVGHRAVTNRLVSLTFDGMEVRESESRLADGDATYLPLDTRFISKPGVFSAEPGRRTIQGIPFRVSDAAIDVGRVKEMKGEWALECDEHLSRTALDGMPETAHLSVPVAWYTRAWVLCALDPDPKRDPILTARLTRFGRSGRGDAISDTSVMLTEKTLLQVGTVRYGNAERPLYLVEIKLEPGKILDLLAMEKDPNASMTASPYLDFELLGRLGGIQAQADRRHKPDNAFRSAAQVFAVTLEKSPVEMRLLSRQPGNIFHNDETRETVVALKSIRPCRVNVGWRIYDIEGATLCEQNQCLEFEAAGAEKRLVVPLTTTSPGWYGLDLTLCDERGREWIKHEAAFAWLGRDTRHAGYESPYGTWWFAGTHYGVADKEIAGPMLFKAGLRKTTFGWTKYTEADMAPWKITQNQIGWRTAPRDPKDYEEAEKRVRAELERFPHCRDADIFHESYAHYIPPELLDEKPDEDEATVRAARQRVAVATCAARFYRERFPGIRLLVGNTSSSDSIIASLLRHGFDPRYMDFIGIEAVGQTCPPEKLWDGGTQGIWLAREVARKFGHELPVSGCFEFTARTDRNLGPRRQAEWYVRDMLLCHAYGFQHINPAILHDCGNAYFNTLWGAGGLCRRHPLLYPKPAYVAVATLTRVLDRVKPLRRVATGSTTVYAYEFERADGQFVCAFWTACGQADLRLRYPEQVIATQVGCYGDERSLTGHELNVRCDTAPIYVVGPRPVAAVTIVGRAFEPPPPGFRVAERMDNADAWSLQEDASLHNAKSRELPLRRPGTFELRSVTDEEKGPCLELRLIRQGRVPDIVGEYTVMRLRQPVAVPGRPTDIGLWVKGDSGWGKIIFDIEDAVGGAWRTEGTWHDWPGELSVCHDGWRFVRFPMDDNSNELNISPSPRWKRQNTAGSSKICFPVKLTGLAVVMHRRALDLTEMKDVAGVLRFQDLGTCQRNQPEAPCPPTSP